MPIYELQIRVKDKNNNYYTSTVKRNLKADYEDNPTIFFTELIKEKIKDDLESQSNCFIGESSLKLIINNWIKDIEKGYRLTILDIALPSMEGSRLSSLKDTGNRAIPELLEPTLPDFMLPLEILLPLDTVFQKYN